MTAIRQHSEAWHALRQASIGGSDQPVLLGLSPWKAEAALAREKRGEAVEEFDELTARRLRLGLALEPVIRREDELKHGIKIRRVNRVHVHPDLPWAMASLDFERVGEKTIVETKASSTRRFGDELPLDVEAQVRWQLGVAGYPRAHVAALISGSDLRCYDVTHDDAIFDQMVAVATDFRRRLVDPDAVFAENAASIKARYPTDDGSEITADAELTEAVEKLLKSRADRHEMEEYEELLATAIKSRMGPAAVLRGPGFKVLWKQQRERRVPNWELVAAGLLREVTEDERERLIDLHSKVIAPRPFVPKRDDEEAP